MAELTKWVGRELLPDPLYVIETQIIGMDVIIRVIEQRGSFEITREIFETRKDKHHWQTSVATFKKLATFNYSQPTNSMANLYKSGS